MYRISFHSPAGLTLVSFLLDALAVLILVCFPLVAPTVLVLARLLPVTPAQEPILHSTNDSSGPVWNIDRSRVHSPVGPTLGSFPPVASAALVPVCFLLDVPAVLRAPRHQQGQKCRGHRDTDQAGRTPSGRRGGLSRRRGAHRRLRPAPHHAASREVGAVVA